MKGELLNNGERVRFVNEADLEEHGCTWHSRNRCHCRVPDYALSGHNRVHYCAKLTQAIESGALKARQNPI